jgi:hypothetical protein
MRLLTWIIAVLLVIVSVNTVIAEEESLPKKILNIQLSGNPFENTDDESWTSPLITPILEENVSYKIIIDRLRTIDENIKKEPKYPPMDTIETQLENAISNLEKKKPSINNFSALKHPEDITPDYAGYWRYDIKHDHLRGLKEPLGLSPTDKDIDKDKEDAALRTVRYIYLINKVLFIKTQNNLKIYNQYLTKLDKQWDFYFNKTLSQYPWEMALNDHLYQKTRGNNGIFNQPPSKQWILLHPAASFEYIGGMTNMKTKNSLILEVLGYNAWKWNDNDSADYSSFLGLSGVSLIADYSDHSDINAPDWGYGLLVHVKSDLAVGITKHDNNIGLIVNYDLSKIFLAPPENNKAEIRGEVQ